MISARLHGYARVTGGRIQSKKPPSTSKPGMLPAENGERAGNLCVAVKRWASAARQDFQARRAAGVSKGHPLARRCVTGIPRVYIGLVPDILLAIAVKRSRHILIHRLVHTFFRRYTKQYTVRHTHFPNDTQKNTHITAHMLRA